MLFCIYLTTCLLWKNLSVNVILPLSHHMFTVEESICQCYFASISPHVYCGGIYLSMLFCLYLTTCLLWRNLSVNVILPLSHHMFTVEESICQCYFASISPHVYCGRIYLSMLFCLYLTTCLLWRNLSVNVILHLSHHMFTVEESICQCYFASISPHVYCGGIYLSMLFCIYLTTCLLWKNLSVNVILPLSHHMFTVEESICQCYFASISPHVYCGRIYLSMLFCIYLTTCLLWKNLSVKVILPLSHHMFTVEESICQCYFASISPHVYCGGIYLSMLFCLYLTTCLLWRNLSVNVILPLSHHMFTVEESICQCYFASISPHVYCRGIYLSMLFCLYLTTCLLWRNLSVNVILHLSHHMFTVEESICQCYFASISPHVYCGGIYLSMLFCIYLTTCLLWRNLSVNVILHLSHHMFTVEESICQCYFASISPHVYCGGIYLSMLFCLYLTTCLLWRNLSVNVILPLSHHMFTVEESICQCYFASISPHVYCGRIYLSMLFCLYLTTCLLWRNLSVNVILHLSHHMFTVEESICQCYFASISPHVYCGRIYLSMLFCLYLTTCLLWRNLSVNVILHLSHHMFTVEESICQCYFASISPHVYCGGIYLSMLFCIYLTTCLLWKNLSVNVILPLSHHMFTVEESICQCYFASISPHVYCGGIYLSMLFCIYLTTCLLWRNLSVNVILHLSHHMFTVEESICQCYFASISPHVYCGGIYLSMLFCIYLTTCLLWRNLSVNVILHLSHHMFTVEESICQCYFASISPHVYCGGIYLSMLFCIYLTTCLLWKNLSVNVILHLSHHMFTVEESICQCYFASISPHVYCGGIYLSMLFCIYLTTCLLWRNLSVNVILHLSHHMFTVEESICQCYFASISPHVYCRGIYLSMLFCIYLTACLLWRNLSVNVILHLSHHMFTVEESICQCYFASISPHVYCGGIYLSMLFCIYLTTCLLTPHLLTAVLNAPPHFTIRAIFPRTVIILSSLVELFRLTNVTSLQSVL